MAVISQGTILQLFLSESILMCTFCQKPSEKAGNWKKCSKLWSHDYGMLQPAVKVSQFPAIEMWSCDNR